MQDPVLGNVNAALFYINYQFHIGSRLFLYDINVILESEVFLFEKPPQKTAAHRMELVMHNMDSTINILPRYPIPPH